MLKINVRGENIEVTGSIREYVEKKLAKLEKYFEDTSSSTAHVNLKVYSDKNCKVEVTIPLPYLVLRAEETSPDMYASIDLVTDKLERQIRKSVSLKPMDAEEAILQMDMLGHDFFIYEDAETSGIDIVYRRRDGRYGLIEASDEE